MYGTLVGISTTIHLQAPGRHKDLEIQLLDDQSTVDLYRKGQISWKR